MRAEAVHRPVPRNVEEVDGAVIEAVSQGPAIRADRTVDELGGTEPRSGDGPDHLLRPRVPPHDPTVEGGDHAIAGDRLRGHDARPAELREVRRPAVIERPLLHVRGAAAPVLVDDGVNEKAVATVPADEYRLDRRSRCRLPERAD